MMWVLAVAYAMSLFFVLGLCRAMSATNLHHAVTDALSTLDALHRRDPWADQCFTCGPEGGRWPCATGEVADDLQDAVDEERR